MLLQIRDATNPTFGTSWEIPGGGVEFGETDAMAAVREICEETGIALREECVGPSSWERQSAYTYRGVRRVQDEFICQARVGGHAPAVRLSRVEADRQEEHFGYRWWPLHELFLSKERFYPKRLPKLLPRFLAGEHIQEPLESWP